MEPSHVENARRHEGNNDRAYHERYALGTAAVHEQARGIRMNRILSDDEQARPTCRAECKFRNKLAVACNFARLAMRK